MIHDKNIGDYIKNAETDYRAAKIEPIQGWSWSMYEHVRRSFLIKNSQLVTGKNNKKPVNNIVLPIVRLQYRLEGYNVKDILLYLTNPKLFYKSTLVRKYHETWALENKMDHFIDSSIESDVDYGGKLVKRTDKSVPDVIPLSSLAFADQQDIMSAPIGILHEMSVTDLKEMEKKGWGDPNKGADLTIDDLIVLAQAQPSETAYDTRGKLKVYEVRGVMPNHWLTGSGDGYSRQLHIVIPMARTGSKDDLDYWTVFKSKAGDDVKFHSSREKVQNRALHRGGIEDLFDPQMWTNYNEIRLLSLLDEAAKTIYKTTDKAFGNRQELRNSKSGKTYYVDGELDQINNFPRSAVLFEKSIDKWQLRAQSLGDAHPALRGEQPPAGSPAALQELVVDTGEQAHDYRKGKNADFHGEIYDDWILPQFGKDLSTEKEFFSELSLKEIQMVARNLSQQMVNRKVIDAVLERKGVMPKEEQDALGVVFQEDFKRGGNERFLKILQNEFKGEKLGIKFNIAGRQANLHKVTKDLLTVISQITSTGGAILRHEGMADLFNQIIEFSGLNPIDFTSFAQENPEQDKNLAVPNNLQEEKLSVV